MYTSTKRSRAQDEAYRSPSRSSSSSPTPTTKVLRLSPSTESQVSSAESAPLLCTLPPTCHPPHNQPTRLTNSNDLEVHYAKYHAYVCEDRGCGAVFPNARLMELHQTECHDPLAAVRKERGEKIFACHLESCPRLFLEPKKRRLHLIQAHGFPKEYFFAVTNKGVGGLLKKWGDGVSLIRKPWKRRDLDDTMNNDEDDSEDEDEDGETGRPENLSNQVLDQRLEIPARRETVSQKADLNALTNSLDSLSLVPPTIRFGRGGKHRSFAQEGQHPHVQKPPTHKPDIRTGEKIEEMDSREDTGFSINIDGALEALKAEIPRPPPVSKPLERGMLHVRGGTAVPALGAGRGRGSGRARIGGRGRGRGRGGLPRGRGQVL